MSKKTVALALAFILSVSADAVAGGFPGSGRAGVGAPLFSPPADASRFVSESRWERPAVAGDAIAPCPESVSGDRRRPPPKAIRIDPLIEIRFGAARGTGGLRHHCHLRASDQAVSVFFPHVPMQITATTVDNAILRSPAASALFPRSPPRRSVSS